MHITTQKHGKASNHQGLNLSVEGFVCLPEAETTVNIFWVDLKKARFLSLRYPTALIDTTKEKEIVLKQQHDREDAEESNTELINIGENQQR